MLKKLYESLKSIWAKHQSRKAQLSRAISSARETIEDIQGDLVVFKENFIAIHYNKSMGKFIGSLLLNISIFTLVKSYIKAPHSANQEECTNPQFIEKNWGYEDIILAIFFNGAFDLKMLMTKSIFDYVCCCFSIARAIKVQSVTVQAYEVNGTVFNPGTNEYEPIEPALEDTIGATVRPQIPEAEVSEEEHQGLLEGTAVPFSPGL